MTDQIIRNAAGIDQRIYDSVKLLSDLDPDRAAAKNFAGWNAADGGFGHDLAAKPFNQWTLKIGQVAYKLIRKYSGQLAAAGITYDEIEDPFTITPQPKKDQATIILEDGVLIFRSHRDHPATDLVRALPHRSWTGRDGTPPYVWRVALDPRNISGLRAIYRLGTVDFRPEALAALKALSSPQRPAPPANDAQLLLPVPAPQEPAHAPQGPSQDGMVRVAHMVADDNTIVYRLKFMPANVRLVGHEYKTAREAQAKADELNGRLGMRRVELS